MATIDDIGVPGQPLNTPPLTAWQAAVRDGVKANTSRLGTITPKAGWLDFGGAYAGMYATTAGRLLVAEGHLKPTADQTLSSSAIAIADLPAGFFPVRDALLPCVYKLTGGYPILGQVTVTKTGTIYFTATAAGTMTASAGWVSFAIALRAA